MEGNPPETLELLEVSSVFIFPLLIVLVGLPLLPIPNLDHMVRFAESIRTASGGVEMNETIELGSSAFLAFLILS